MCELLGMSANVPTDICFSFAGLVERGGRTGPHRDGWGITFYEGKGCRSFKDPLPGCESDVAHLLKSYPIKSESVISHIRQANSGKVCLENTHPFTREWWGKNWTYAHNGQLAEFKQALPLGRFRPVGTTDSEWVFCWIMEQLAITYPNAPPDTLEAMKTIAGLIPTVQALGVFNLLLSDGVYLLACCSNNLHWLTRRAPFGQATLIDADVTIDFKKETTPNDIVTVIATAPLTLDEQWNKMQPGETVIFKQGEQVA